MTARPNYVVIVTDQHCAGWLGCAGHDVIETPNIDRLARRGVRFTEFHTASPVCMPNRASILTARYPSIHGLKYNGCALSPNARTFVEMLKDGGYQTAAIGKSHLQPFTGVDVARIKSPDPSVPELEAWKNDFHGLDIESPRYYRDDGRLEFPLPYYGYDYVDMVTGHGDTAGGHYLQWLRRQDPKCGGIPRPGKRACAQLLVPAGEAHPPAGGAVSDPLYRKQRLRLARDEAPRRQPVLHVRVFPGSAPSLQSARARTGTAIIRASSGWTRPMAISRIRRRR